MSSWKYISISVKISNTSSTLLLHAAISIFRRSDCKVVRLMKFWDNLCILHEVKRWPKLNKSNCRVWIALKIVSFWNNSVLSLWKSSFWTAEFISHYNPCHFCLSAIPSFRRCSLILFTTLFTWNKSWCSFLRTSFRLLYDFPKFISSFTNLFPCL